MGVFDTPDELEAAVDQLQVSGFDRGAISVLASDQIVKERLGRLYDSVAEIVDDPRAPLAAFVSNDSRTEGEAATVGAPLFGGTAMALTSTQHGVTFGMAGGAVASAAVWLVPWIAPVPILPAGDCSRLAFWLPWELPPLATLAYGIAWTAQHRFFHAGVIDGQDPSEDRELASGRAYLQNTVEQFSLAFAVHAILAVVLPVRYLSVLPALAIWFTFSRVLFRAGYSKGAAARSFGFAGTFYPSLIGIAAAPVFALLR